MVSLDAIIPGQNIEFTDAQKFGAAELDEELDKTVYRCIFDNMRGQAHKEAVNFITKDKGKRLVQHMNFLYRGASTAQTSELLQNITGFSIPAKGDPTNTLTRFKESNLKLATFEGHSLSEIVQCNIIVAALNKIANYQNLPISLNGKDAGTIKIEELCNTNIRFYSNTHEGWGVNPTAEELNSGGKNVLLRRACETTSCKSK